LIFITTAEKQMNPARKPITIAQRGSTKPAAGVMATKPATTPEAAPRALAFPILIYSAISQPMSPAPVATWVLVNARTAISSAARKIQGSHVTQPPTTPDPMANRIVNHSRPYKNEDDISFKVHSFGHSSADKGSSDDGEHQLKHAEQIFWDGTGKGLKIDSCKEGFAQVSDKMSDIITKG
jgi:hypothetical protein